MLTLFMDHHVPFAITAGLRSAAWTFAPLKRTVPPHLRMIPF